MRLVFRADASQELGTGHVMRCSSIAEEALTRDIPCVFVGSLGGVRWIEERLALLGIPVVSLSDFQDFRDSDLLIIDSYLRETQDSFIKCNEWVSIVVIVDESSPVPEGDLYIHPGLECSWFSGDRTKLVYGPRFIPLRKMVEKRHSSQDSRLGKIVVFGGGADTFGFALEMSQILSEAKGFDSASFFSSESAKIGKLDPRFRAFEFGRLLDHELSQADLVFTTASTSSLEVVAREIPLGIACSVENQKSNFRTLAESGVAVQIGGRSESGSWILDTKVIYDLISNPGIRAKMSKASSNFIDLHGASRILDAVESL